MPSVSPRCRRRARSTAPAAPSPGTVTVRNRLESSAVRTGSSAATTKNPADRPEPVLFYIDRPLFFCRSTRPLPCARSRSRSRATKAELPLRRRIASLGQIGCRARAHTASSAGHLWWLRIHVRHRDQLREVSRLEHAQAATARQRRASGPHEGLARSPTEDKGSIGTWRILTSSGNEARSSSRRWRASPSALPADCLDSTGSPAQLGFRTAPLRVRPEYLCSRQLPYTSSEAASTAGFQRFPIIIKQGYSGLLASTNPSCLGKQARDE